MPSSVSGPVFSHLFLSPAQNDHTTGDPQVGSPQMRRSGSTGVAASAHASTDPQSAPVDAGRGPAFDLAARQNWGRYLKQLGSTIEALLVPDEDKATLRKRLADCEGSFEQIEADVQDVLKAEGHGVASDEGALPPKPAKVMAAAMKLVVSCETAIRQVRELDDTVRPHVNKPDVLKIVALTVGALVGIAAAVALAIVLAPVVIPALTVGGIGMLAMCSSTVAAGAVGAAIAAAYCAWDLARHPEAYRHMPQHQPELASLLTKLGEAAENWLTTGGLTPDDFSWADFKAACGGEEQAHRLVTAIEGSSLPDNVKNFIRDAREGDGQPRFGREEAVANAAGRSGHLLSAEEWADMHGEDFEIEGPNRSSVHGDGVAVSGDEIDDAHDLYTWDEIIELYWRGLGFSARNPPAPEGPGIDASDADQGEDESLSDNVLKRQASSSSIASNTSYTTVFAMDDEVADNGDPIRSIDPHAGDAHSAVTAVASAAQPRPLDTKAAWDGSKRWAEGAARTARLYLDQLSPGLTAAFPEHVSDPDQKLDIMARTLAAYSLLEAARADVAAMAAAHQARPDAFAREDCLGRLAVILKMEKSPHLNADVGGLRVLDDPGAYVEFSSLPQPEAPAVRSTWDRMATEASSLLDELDRACSHAFKPSFRGKLPDNANLSFRKEVVARRTEIQRELQRLADQHHAGESSSAVLLSLA